MPENDLNNKLLPVIEKSEIVHDEFIKIRRDSMRLQDQDYQYNYYTLITPGSAVVTIGVTSEKKLILNREYRHPVGDYLLCAPGGYLVPQEDPISGARRELLEETGYDSENVALIGSAYPYPGISAQIIYYAAAIDVEYKTAPKLEPTEFIKTVIMTHDEVWNYIREGKPVDGTLCTALFFYYRIGTG